MNKKVSIIKGDGIGPEIMDSVLSILTKAKAPLDFQEVVLGERALKEKGSLTPQESLNIIEKNKVALKSPLNTPIGEGFSSVNVFLRKKFNLHLNLRPVKNLPNVETKFSNVDIIVMRENVQGLYIGEGQERSETEARTVSIMKKKELEDFFDQCFKEIKKRNRKKVLIAHKANILKSTSGLFLDTAKEVAQKEGVEVDSMIIDALSMNLVKNPERFDTIITSNLFGDILSDLCAGLVGGLGVAPGANIGPNMAIFEAVHGTAPDIAGKDLANPLSLLLSACLMLDYLDLQDYSQKVKKAINLTLEEGFKTKDLGGSLGCKDFTQKICSKL